MMDHIRQVIADMEQEESALESRRAAEYFRRVWLTRMSLFLAKGLAVLGSVMLAY